MGLILGVNKYSHDTALVIADEGGKILFAGEKERITRAKHDGGDISALVAHGLEAIGACVDDVELVVSNNHHFRCLPFEKRLPWAVSMGHYPPSYLEPTNLLPNAVHAELSHHLAHAFGAAAAAPFRSGLVVVADGMGESQAVMDYAEERRRRSSRNRRRLERYYTDLEILYDEEGVIGKKLPEYQEWLPWNGSPYSRREAESAYLFEWPEGGKLRIRPIYKRWQQERSPPELENHGFENMESLGAVYSRISSHIFGDWNACGKVMGLAPWAKEWCTPAERDAVPVLMQGNLLYPDGCPGAFEVNWEALEALPHPNGLYGASRAAGIAAADGGEEEDSDNKEGSRRAYFAALAGRVQSDLEAVMLQFVSGLKERCGAQAENLVVCGGVALNSVANGRLARELGFQKVFFESCPGDEGVALGCAMFGVHSRERLLLYNAEPEAEEAVDDTPAAVEGASVTRPPAGAFIGALHGRSWSAEEVLAELNWYDPWISVTDLRTDETASARAAAAAAAAEPEEAAAVDHSSSAFMTALEAEAENEAAMAAAAAIAAGDVVAWFQGRSEFGPRALGSRSILADPRDASMVDYINRYVKKREDFRPFAPSVLAEDAGDWFEGVTEDSSPFMSVTANAKAALPQNARIRRPAAAKQKQQQQQQQQQVFQMAGQRPSSGPTAAAVVAEGDEVSSALSVAEVVPAVCHVDGSARLQTVRLQDNPLYHKLISEFKWLTGVPMVLNTSFNTLKGEPIVDSPADALRSFLDANGHIALLAISGFLVRRRLFPLDQAEVEGAGTKEGGNARDLWELVPAQADGFVSERRAREDGEVLSTRIMLRDGTWKSLKDDLELAILEVVDGEATVTELVAEFADEAGSDVSEDEVISRLRSLYYSCLITL